MKLIMQTWLLHVITLLQATHARAPRKNIMSARDARVHCRALYACVNAREED